MSIDTETLTRGFELIALGWPVAVAIAKRPIGGIVKGKTTDTGRLAQLLGANPGAQLGIATGPPGPTILDIDRIPECLFFERLVGLKVPQVLTGREGGGHHFYFRGDDRLTSGSIPGGEIRSVNSFAVCPPSIHDKTGQPYTWVNPPTAELQPVPGFVMEALVELQQLGADAFIIDGTVTEGNRHPFLKARLLTEASHGVTTINRLVEIGQMLNDEVCQPPVKKNEIEKMARWVSQSRVAQDAKAHGGNSRGRRKSTLEAPADTTDLAAQVAFLNGALRLPDGLSVKSVKRWGHHDKDAMVVHLSDGTAIHFPHQAQAAKAADLKRIVIGHTNGRAQPKVLTDDAFLVFGALCAVAGAVETKLEEVWLVELVQIHLRETEVLESYSAEPENRAELIEALSLRNPYEPRRRSSPSRPVLIVDALTGRRFVRAGELWATFCHHNSGISPAEFPGRMAMIGVGRWRCRVTTGGTDSLRRNNRAEVLLYELPEELF